MTAKIDFDYLKRYQHEIVTFFEIAEIAFRRCGYLKLQSLFPVVLRRVVISRFCARMPVVSRESGRHA